MTPQTLAPAALPKPKMVTVRMLQNARVSTDGRDTIDAESGQEVLVEAVTAKGLFRDRLAERARPMDTLEQLLEERESKPVLKPILGTKIKTVTGPAVEFSVSFPVDGASTFVEADWTMVFCEEAYWKARYQDVTITQLPGTPPIEKELGVRDLKLSVYVARELPEQNQADIAAFCKYLSEGDSLGQRGYGYRLNFTELFGSFVFGGRSYRMAITETATFNRLLTNSSTVKNLFEMAASLSQTFFHTQLAERAR